MSPIYLQNAKEPYISTKEPNTSAKEPSVDLRSEVCRIYHTCFFKEERMMREKGVCWQTVRKKEWEGERQGEKEGGRVERREGGRERGGERGREGVRKRGREGLHWFGETVMWRLEQPSCNYPFSF